MNRVLDLENFTLQDWIEELLLCSSEELCRKYVNEDAVYQEIGYPHLNTDPVMSGLVDEDLLVQLHLKLRELPCEDPIWDGVVWYLGQCLPPHIAHDFIDRKIIFLLLGHSPQTDDILRRLFDETEWMEPLLTMAKARYEEDDWSLSAWEEILVEVVDYDPGGSYCLEIITGWIASCAEKEDAFYEVVRQHPKQSEILRAVEEHRAFSEFHDQLQEAESSDADIEAFQTFYNPERANYLLHLAQHEDSTPLLLQKLAQFKKSKYASKIRAAAKSELYRRQKLSAQDDPSFLPYIKLHTKVAVG
ncbi:MAG TPA: hypothetical protein VM821_07260 [Abditibacteriaceae bacterium]|jgi:hypothetical protein|nr:hypothetical protein [Abditibacteriaceae bacterium]